MQTSPRRRAGSILGCALTALLAVTVIGGPRPASAQIAFEQAVRDLASPDAAVRLRTIRALRDARYPEAAVPLAASITDSQDAVQLEAIAAELAIFLADDRDDGSRRLSLRTNPLTAESVFARGPEALGSRLVPIEVVTALRSAVSDDNQRVATEALYAFGTLAPHGSPADRAELLRVSGPQLLAAFGARDISRRYAAVRVVGRVYAHRPEDKPVEYAIGDATIMALNDKDRGVQSAAMHALGEMRYERGTQALADLLAYHKSGLMAEAALDALAHIASLASVPVLIEQLSSKSAPMRAIAVEGLARSGNQAGLVEAQMKLATDRNDAVHLALAFAATVVTNAPLDALGEGLVRQRQHDQARTYLIELAPGRTALFTRHVQDPDAFVRKDVVEILMLGGDPAALALIEPLQHDKDAGVAHAAERATAYLRAIAASRPR